MDTHVLNKRLVEVKPLAEPVVGLRVFLLDASKGLLQSLNGGYVWEPGVPMRSACSVARAHGHVKPEADCTCGFWSCKSRKALTKAFPQAFFKYEWYPIHFEEVQPRYYCARIQQWGVVIKHEHGWRSEYARIIPETIQFWPRVSKDQIKNPKLLLWLRERYAWK
jgi:hypothetical protein